MSRGKGEEVEEGDQLIVRVGKNIGLTLKKKKMKKKKKREESKKGKTNDSG